MVGYCAAFNCKNQQNSSNKAIHFHRFPLARPAVLKQWNLSLRRKNWKPTKFSKLCSEHFTPDSYLIRPGAATKRLKEDAVPSIFDYRKYLKQPPSKKRKILIVKHLLVGNVGAESLDKEHEQPESIDCRPIDDEPCTSQNGKLSPTKVTPRIDTQAKLRRGDVKISNMKDLISNLKKNGHTSSNLHVVLKNHFGGFPLESVINQSKNQSVSTNHRTYTRLMKEFALTLYFYSPKAYRHVRRILHLPHKSQINEWASSVNCEPGLISEVFEYLKGEAPKNSALKNCALIFDSMSLRRQIVWNKRSGKYTGYVDCGDIAQVDHEGLATEALVLQIVSLSGSFKCAVGYFLINKMSAITQSQIIKVCLSKLDDAGVTVHAVTCDGCSANLKTLSSLGCNFETGDEFKTSFRHPNNKTNVFAFLDPCHMLKLARNALAENGSINSDVGIIEWDFIVKLNNLQQKEQLKFANALSGVHASYKNKKMNVCLAAHTLNTSVADALEHLGKFDPNFRGCGPTVHFIRTINRLFDLLNSRNIFGKGFKQPLTLANKHCWEAFCNEALEYLASLRIEDMPIFSHRRKTFALGFSICVKSVQGLALYLLNEMHHKCFLTYRISQDNVDLLFSRIRSRTGNDNNPNVNEFKYALRRLLFKNSVTSGDNANCINFDSSAECSILEFRSSKRSIIDDDCGNGAFESEINDYMKLIDSKYLSDFSDNILYYISGYIIGKILIKLTCTECHALLTTNLPQRDVPRELAEHSYASFYQPGAKALTLFVNRGGSKFACDSVFQIVQRTERTLRHYYVCSDDDKPERGQILDLVVYSVTRYFSQPIMVRKLDSLGFRHAANSEISFEDLHYTQLVKLIAKMYADLRLLSDAKGATLNMRKNSPTMRHRLNKVGLYGNV